MARRRGRSPVSVNEGAASQVTAVRVVRADGAAVAHGRTAVGALRAWVAAASATVYLTATEARAACYVAGMARQDVDLSDPELLDVIAPALRLTVDDAIGIIAGATGQAPPRPSVRRLLQALRDDGDIEAQGGGVYMVRQPDVSWPETDRAAGWVLPKRGGGDTGYAL